MAFGLSKDTKKFPSKASFHFRIYSIDGGVDVKSEKVPEKSSEPQRLPNRALFAHLFLKFTAALGLMLLALRLSISKSKV